MSKNESKMTKKERKEKLDKITDMMDTAFDLLIASQHDLEDLMHGRGAQWRKLDTITGKLYNLIYDLSHRE